MKLTSPDLKKATWSCADMESIESSSILRAKKGENIL